MPEPIREINSPIYAKDKDGNLVKNLPPTKASHVETTDGSNVQDALDALSDHTDNCVVVVDSLDNLPADLKGPCLILVDDGTGGETEGETGAETGGETGGGTETKP